MSVENLINKITHGDCMDIMMDMPDNYFQLSICDPPYGIGAGNRCDFGEVRSKSAATKTNNYKNKLWDKTIPDEKYFNELFRISKNQIIWGVNYYNCFDLSGGRIFWDKNNPINYSKSAGELAFKSFGHGIDIVKITWNGMIQENMKEKEKRIHPTQKPVALYRWILQNYAKPGQLILDTHSGSGSLACACHLEKYDFIAIEKDIDYYNDSVKRLDELKSQGVLF